MFRFKYLILLILIAVIGYFIYVRVMMHGGAGHEMAGMPPNMAMPVSVAEVLERQVQEWNEFSGRLVAVDQVEIRPRVSGTIDSIHFSDGDNVKKGAVLFTIDPRPYEAAYQAANARAILTETEFSRAERLMADKAISQREYDQRKNDVRVARADLTRAKLDLGYTKIVAPIPGRVSRAEITVGNLVDAGGNAPVLTTIVSNRPIYADFDVDESTYLRYTRGADGQAQSFDQIPVMMGLATETGTPHTGRIESFDNKLNPASGTIRVRAIFENADGSLVPGLFARIKLGSPTETKALLITDRAVGTDQSKKFVLVVGNDNKVEYREVKLGNVADGLRIVQNGVQAGDKIVVNGLQRARPGSVVAPEIVPMDDKQPAASASPTPASAESTSAGMTEPAMPAADPAPASPTPPAESSPASAPPEMPKAPESAAPGSQQPAAKE
ncbi:MAG: efflux RND transporter periplasmic adaptor subunit [Alphaproteobacteria bacterium]|nr:MAG: efflux RND transporter periplasmic adaptor subunit [Alphaproteobacteria bacterium]